jgi:penicillin-binding protein 1A
VIGNPALTYMVQMMRQVIAVGTGTKAKVAGYDLAGKTGTTSDYKDAWFIGYTGGFTAAVWLGRDDNTPMRKVAGGGAPTEIWHTFMAAVLPRLKVTPIPTNAAMATPQADDDAIGNVIDDGAAVAPEPTPAPDAAPQPSEPATPPKGTEENPIPF